MKKLAAIAFACAIAWPSVAPAAGSLHGGSYPNPPTDPPPPPPPPSTPTPGGGYGGPGDGVPNGPSTPGPGGPAPAPPVVQRPRSQEGAIQLDSYDWQLWWHKSREPYLDLKQTIHFISSTGGDVFFIGHGQTRTRVSPMVPSRAVLESKVLPILVLAIQEERNNDIVTSALDFIGEARSIDPLLEMFLDESLTDGARAFAVVALGIVGDRDLLPWSSELTVNLNYFVLTETMAGGGKGVLEIL